MLSRIYCSEFVLTHLDDEALVRMGKATWELYRSTKPPYSGVPNVIQSNAWVIYAACQKEAEKRGIPAFWEHLR